MSRRPEHRRRRARASVAILVMLTLSSAGCAAPGSTEPPAPSSTVAPTETPVPVPSAVVFVPEGDADDNLPLFAQVVAAVWASPENASGRAYIDALTAAGFDKTAMQVTNDTSTVGNRAESLQFSILWGDECLVGQVGPATGDPVAVVVPALPEGGCLIGATRPIDW